MLHFPCAAGVGSVVDRGSDTLKPVYFLVMYVMAPGVNTLYICLGHLQREGYPDPSAFCSNIGHVLAKEICFILCKHSDNADNGA